MNCDEAFELITHPTDHQCKELQWHLELCPRCRQMQETLSPALSSFHQILGESSDENELTDHYSDMSPTADHNELPAFPAAGKPFLSAETVRMAEQAATRLTAETSLNRKASGPAPLKPNQKRLMSAALILMAGILMGWGISLDVPENSVPGAASLPQGQQSCLWIAQREEIARYSARMEKSSVNNVVLSCVACHLQSSAE
ncbi:hypothetical protein [Gimesia algae]|uniref:Zinc-finger domain-containing protein n=1 Tax=Gimesia algae TaxID=2527971 RepID=A0A517VCM1_9PLAN|nr:hypothetical protein [Gimesia algae]QDT90756.1 hypothetical protein Pan161_24090 [Gimesia algae]